MNTKPGNSKIGFLFCPQGLSLYICRPLNAKYKIISLCALRAFVVKFIITYLF